MDHIPLEIHMGLERKGELPDKMHCTLLSTKCWIMGWLFLPNPEGHGCILCVFSQTLWVLRFLGFESCVTCQGQLLLPWPLSPLCTKHMSMPLSEEPVSGDCKKWGAGGGVLGFSSFSASSRFPPPFSPAFCLYSFHPSFLPYFFYPFYLHPHFFLTL